MAAGYRTVTARHDDPITPGSALFALEDDEKNRTLTGTVTSIERYPVDTLTTEQAKLPDDAHINDLRSGLQKHYPAMPDDAEVDVVTFSLNSNVIPGDRSIVLTPIMHFHRY